MEIMGFHVNISMFIWWAAFALVSFISLRVAKGYAIKASEELVENSDERSTAESTINKTYKLLRMGVVAICVVAFPIVVLFFGVSKTDKGHERIEPARYQINYVKPTEQEIAEDNKSYESQEYKKLNEESAVRREKARAEYEEALRKAIEEKHQN